MHQGQGLSRHPVWDAYNDEELKFMKAMCEVPIGKVPNKSNVMTSYIIYIVKEDDHGSLKIKARIASHDKKRRRQEHAEN